MREDRGEPPHEGADCVVDGERYRASRDRDHHQLVLKKHKRFIIIKKKRTRKRKEQQHNKKE